MIYSRYSQLSEVHAQVYSLNYEFYTMLTPALFIIFFAPNSVIASLACIDVLRTRKCERAFAEEAKTDDCRVAL